MRGRRISGWSFYEAGLGVAQVSIVGLWDINGVPNRQRWRSV